VTLEEQLFLKDQQIVTLESRIERLNNQIRGLTLLLEIAEYNKLKEGRS